MTAPVIAARYSLYKGVMISAKIVMLKDVPLERAAAEDGVIGRYNHFNSGIFAYSRRALTLIYQSKLAPGNLGGIFWMRIIGKGRTYSYLGLK